MADGPPIVRVLHPWQDADDDDSPLERTKRPHCLHLKVRLDLDSHKVLCRKCEVEVDPFAVLLRITRDWDRWVEVREAAKHRALAAQARLDETLRLERNARARVRRRDPAAKLPRVPWGERSL